MTHPPRRPRIGFISTSNYAIRFFLRPYINSLAINADIVLIANTEHGTPDQVPGVTFIPMPFVRTPNPIKDLKNLIQLSAILRAQKLDMVYSISPKGGLLGMMAATLVRVKLRVHFFTGQVWITRTGIWRRILKGLDRLIGRMAHMSLVDSPNQQSFLIAEKVLKAEKSAVLGAGSMAGINTQRFKPDPAARADLRARLNIPETMKVIIFLGRLTRDKGVQNLMEAFTILSKDHSDLGLLLVGPDENMMAGLKQQARSSNLAHRVWFTGGVSQPEHYFAAGDIFCLPSFREGFPMVILEAAATGLPTVGSNIYGINDAVVDGKTGLLHTVKDSADLASKLNRLVTDECLRDTLGQAARTRIHTQFNQNAMIKHFMTFHTQMIAKGQL